MVRRALVRPGSSAGDRGATHSDVSRVPAAPAAGNLLDRPGYGKVDEPEEQQLISDRARRDDRSHFPCWARWSHDREHRNPLRRGRLREPIDMAGFLVEESRFD